MLMEVGVVDSHIICGKVFRVGIPSVGGGHQDLENRFEAVKFMTGGLSGVEV